MSVLRRRHRRDERATRRSPSLLPVRWRPRPHRPRRTHARGVAERLARSQLFSGRRQQGYLGSAERRLMMLSRIADSLFWIGRYMERADNTARILDVNYHMLLEQPPDTYKLRWDPLIAVTGERARFYKLHEEASAQTAFEFLGFAEENPNSISQCIVNARENARTIRDRISRELWEDINTLYHKVRRLREGDESLSRFCEAVKRGGHRFHGVCDATLARDEGWHFVQAGCVLERAEMTARILDVHYHQLLEGPQILNEARSHLWMAVLKSVAAFEFYKRQYTQIET